MHIELIKIVKMDHKDGSIALGRQDLSQFLRYFLGRRSRW